MAFNRSKDVDASRSTFNDVGQDQYTSQGGQLINRGVQNIYISSFSEQSHLLNPGAEQAIQITATLISSSAKRSLKDEGSRFNAKKILNGLNQIVKVVEKTAQIHENAKDVITTFKGVLSLESQRQPNNEEQIAVVAYSMACAVHKLHYISQALPNKDDFGNAVGPTLGQLEEDISNFGQFSYLYYQNKEVAFRVFRADTLQEKLLAFNNKFKTRRQNLNLVLSRIDRAFDVALNAENEQDNNISENIRTIISRVGRTDDKEKQAYAFISSNGGPQSVQQSEKLFTEAIKKMGARTPSNELRVALDKDIDVLIDEIEQRFDVDLKGQKQKMNTALDKSKDVVLQSNEDIIRRLDDGPYMLIEDEDIKNVWKENKWGTSIASEVFVEAVGNYFDRKFHQYEVHSDKEHEDKWTLYFLSKIRFHSSICDAIDSDGSGFISVNEANRFFASESPDKWTVPRRLAFWAAAWIDDNIQYYYEIEQLLEDIRSALDEVRHKNKKIDTKIYEKCLGFIDTILQSLEDGAVENQEDNDSMELLELQYQYRQRQQESIQSKLDDVDHTIEDKTTVIGLISDISQDRVELSFMCLLYLLLEHQLEVLSKTEGRKARVKQDTINSMAEALFGVFNAFNSRMRELVWGWRSQRIDPALMIHSFAGGLFTCWYSDSFKPKDQLDEIEDLFNDEDEDKDDEDDEDEETDRMTQLAEQVTTLETKIDSIETLLKSLMSNLGFQPPPDTEKQKQNKTKVKEASKSSKGNPETDVESGDDEDAEGAEDGSKDTAGGKTDDEDNGQNDDTVGNSHSDGDDSGHHNAAEAEVHDDVESEDDDSKRMQKAPGKPGDHEDDDGDDDNESGQKTSGRSRNGDDDGGDQEDAGEGHDNDESHDGAYSLSDDDNAKGTQRASARHTDDEDEDGDNDNESRQEASERPHSEEEDEYKEEDDDDTSSQKATVRDEDNEDNNGRRKQRRGPSDYDESNESDQELEESNE